MFDLFQSRYLLLPFCGSDPGVLFRKIEIFGIGILDSGLVACLPCQPLKEMFKLGYGRMQGRLAQLFPGLVSLLLGKGLLEGNGLLEAKCLEIAIPGIDLKAT
jgi:hypothetical protein